MTQPEINAEIWAANGHKPEQIKKWLAEQDAWEAASEAMVAAEVAVTAYQDIVD